jgi:hypothetical protein
MSFVNILEKAFILFQVLVTFKRSVPICFKCSTFKPPHK